ncbi:MAG: AAA family ATPase [Candidatus Margulisiibacteriota bacterium]
MPVISVINQKGGCGKTTTAVNLSAALAANRKKVLLIDMDSQGHAALALGVSADHKSTIFDALDFDIDKPIKDVIVELSSYLHIVPSNIFLCALEQKLAGRAGREDRLQEKLTKLRRSYDYVIIDCPPSLGLLTINALIASQKLIVPVDTSMFSLHGIEKLQETVNMLRSQLGHRLELFGCATMFDNRTKYAKVFINKLREIFGKNLYQTTIPRTIKLREAVDAGTSIIDYSPASKGAHAYLSLAAEILKIDQAKTVKLFKSKHRQRDKKETTFTLSETKARIVQLAGEFNNWDPARTPLKEEYKGNWTVAFPLTAGSYQYKYVVDGLWIPDPRNNNVMETELGGVNSVIVVN